MKIFTPPLQGKKVSALLLLAFILASVFTVNAQDNCEIAKLHGEGYTTTISSVTDNGDNSYTIVLIAENDGCAGCKKLNRYSIEADPGTYSGISVEVLSGNFTYANIDYGPNLSSDPFQGFRINNANGMGNGQAASFSLTYTLTGGLQDQQFLVKAGSYNLIVSFSAAEFQSVLNCQNQNIFPYYNPLENGKSYDLIGSELTSLYYSYLDNGSYISDDIFQIVGNSVLIEIYVLEGQYDSTLNLLASPAYGLTSEVGDPEQNIISGLLPIVNLLSLNDLPTLINYVRPVYSALGNAGIVTSQGDTAMRSYLARNGFNLTGNGIKIGVLSDSYNTRIGNPAGDDVLRQDLPGVDNPDFLTPVDVVKDYPYGSLSDEGRAMLHIVHDIAPGAELAFRTGFLGAADFAKGIYELQQTGCDIIVDDITYISEPFFRDGVVAQAVDSVSSLGVAYFSAAGNFGSKSWQSPFYAAPAPAGTTGEAHNFAGGVGGNDIYQSITLEEGTYTVVFQWDDGTPGNMTNSDFDIYLSNDDGTTLFGFNRVNTGGAPVEVLPFNVAGGTAQTNFLIVRESGSGPANLKYIIFRGNVTINEYDTPGASTIMGQANAESAITVGAVLYTNTPEYGVDPPTIASFSSRGGTPVDGIYRYKPEITAPNGVNTNVDLGGVNYEGDDFPNFFGTSAAAPHAAAVGALILEARTKYYGSGLSPELLKGVMQNTARDMETPGYDPASGAGFILADAALQTLANPSPYITGIYYDTTLVPGQDTIWLTVYGQYLTDESEVYFNGSPVDSSLLLGDSAVISIIPPFDELYPEIQVYNPPLEGTNGTDGGLSNPLYFTTKETILVNIDDASKKYGEVLPGFSADFLVVNTDTSLSLESAGLTQAEIDRIYTIDLVTIANSLSNVGLWAIEADPNDPLNPESGSTATDSLDISLLQRYNFVFQNGFLSIEKLDLIIIPNDTSFIFNDSIGGFTFEYIFNNDTLNNIDIEPSDSLAILSALLQAHGTALVNATALVRGTALVNEWGETLLDTTALMNTSMMISQALVQSRGTALVNGELIDAQSLLNATVQSNATALVRGTALVNALELVRGTALVNELDTAGNVINSTPLTNATALVNAGATALVNTSTISEESNKEGIVILGEDDIFILSGDSTGEVTIRSINLITGNEVGQHLIVPGSLLSNNFNISYRLGELTIEPDTAEIIIDPASLVQTYDGTPKYLMVNTVPAGLNLVVTYNGQQNYPVESGTYQVVITVLDGNWVGSVSASLVISPAMATVSTTLEIYSIDKGDSLPAFTAAFDGFLAGDDESVVTSLIFSLSPNYSGAAGTYQVIPQATADNYVFTPIPGTLYVNPAGPGTKQVKPIFLCYEELTEPDSSGFMYLAHFEYENKNSTAIYIPVGPDNEITGGAHNNIQQPEVFLPGGGSFVVPYDGNQITWQVTSNKNTGSKGAIPANSSNTQCNKSAEAETPAEAMNEEPAGLKVFPNPTTGKFFIPINGDVIEGKDIKVFDIFGKECQISPVQPSGLKLEVDLTGFSAGLYLVRITREDSVEVLRVIKN